MARWTVALIALAAASVLASGRARSESESRTPASPWLVGELRAVVVDDRAPRVAELRRQGWLVCAGQSVPRKDYPELYAAVGSSWGGAPEDSFRLPDLRGHFRTGRLTPAQARVHADLLGSDSLESRPGEAAQQARDGEVSYFIYAGRDQERVLSQRRGEADPPHRVASTLP